MKAARQRAGMSQRALAAASGVRQPNIAAIESGRTTPTAETLDRLLRAAAVRPSVVLAARRDCVLDALERAGAGTPRVFGSVARGTDTPHSDVDLLVDLGETPSLWALAGLTLELEEILGTRVDVVDDAGANSVLDQARSEAIPL